MYNEEEYLKKHLEQREFKHKPEIEKPKDSSRTIDLNYQSFDCSLFPCGIFYPTGTSIQIRPALVKEIQAYSMVDDNNFPDIIDKMNDMIMSCVRVKYSDGSIGTYLDVKEQDRIYILFLIRELTFQQGMYLTVTKSCQCKTDTKIELKASNFEYFKMSEKLEKYFDNYNKCFSFDFNGKTFNLTIPNIGLQKSFTEYIAEEVGQKKTPELSFLKIMPYLLGDLNKISIKEIKEQLKIYQEMTLEEFQFLNSAVSYMKFGIENLKKLCAQCGSEVRTEMVFPDGASGIFVVHDAFERFIEE